MFKKTLSSFAIAAASATLVSPLAFPKVVDGCSNPAYVFATSNNTDAQRNSAKLAKTGFCKTAKVATENAGLRW